MVSEPVKLSRMKREAANEVLSSFLGRACQIE